MRCRRHGNHLSRVLSTLALAPTLMAAGAVGAAGFSLPESSTAGIGLANALVADPNERGAFSYNPAAMGFHQTSSLALGTILIGPSFSVRTDSGNHDSQGAEWLAGPMIQAALRLNDDWRVGLGISAPFGLETRWTDGTFPAVSGTAHVPGLPPSLNPNVPKGHPTASKLEILDIAPSLAYRVSDDLSVAAGLDVYWAKHAQLDSTANRMSGDGTGLGFNLGVLYRLGDWSFGAAYRSSADISIDGPYQPLSPTLVAIKRLPPAQDAEVDIELPWRFQLGARYQVTEQLAVELDWARTGWSTFDTLEIRGNNTDELIFRDQNRWSDSNAYRIGATYQIRPATRLRFGYAYDQTGQDDAHFSPRVPDSDRQLLSAGLAQSLGNGYSLELGYMYVVADDRRIKSATPYTGGPINGTSAVDGDYQMHAHLIGIEINKVFE
ncbi:MAG: porin [Sphingobacteriia bacterium]|nr:porin [Sphingobacteriia bacterium]NCC40132.1 porin [Gammaproteobacteria bacterium]